jgi:hypothetical protein
MKHLNYRIIPELKLILECCKGQVTVEDAIKMKETQLFDELYDSNYNIIIDFREFVLKLEPQNIKMISILVDFLSQHEIKSKVALLATEPHQVIICEYIKRFGMNLTINFNTFSTLESAIRFVECPINEIGRINNKIVELNKLK